MSSSHSEDPYYTTEGGIDLYEGSIWAWENHENCEPVWYFRFVQIQDSSSGLHAVIYTQDGNHVGVHLPMFDSPQIREVTDEDEIGFALLVLV